MHGTNRIFGRREPPPSNWNYARCHSWLLATEAISSMAKATPAGASKKASANVAKRVAELLTEVIDERWPGSDRELYEAAKVSSSSLTNLKTEGVDSVTSVLKKVCRVLRIDADALIEGRVEKATSAMQRSDLHDLLDSLIGTEAESAVESMLKALNRTHAD
jgi:DNA-binding Xre family transcriptional regulator